MMNTDQRALPSADSPESKYDGHSAASLDDVDTHVKAAHLLQGKDEEKSLEGTDSNAMLQLGNKGVGVETTPPGSNGEGHNVSNSDDDGTDGYVIIESGNEHTIGTQRFLSRRGGTIRKVQHGMIPKQISDEERKTSLFKCIDEMDVDRMEKVLKAAPGLARCTDESGVSALERIMRLRERHMLETFIRGAGRNVPSRLDVTDHALLYAIRDDDITTVKQLLGLRRKYCDIINSNDSQLKTKESSLKKTAVADMKTVAGGLRFSQAAMVVTKLQHTKKAATMPGKVTWQRRGGGGVAAGFEDAEFSCYITPVILAAKLGRRDVLGLLVEHDHCEIHALTGECQYEDSADCEICSPFSRYKSNSAISFEESMRLIEIYKALSSPAFIFHMSNDPVLEAFMICEKMNKMKDEDPSFKDEYSRLAHQCSQFACELLNLCRSTTEIHTFFSEKNGVKRINTIGENDAYPRICVALHYQQKDMIVHPHCQHVMEHIWHTGLPRIIQKTSYYKITMFLYILLWTVLWPFLCVGFMFKVNRSLIRFMKAPVNKFISDNISFGIFLGLLIANVVQSNKAYSETLQEDRQGDLFRPVEWLIFAWVTGMTARLIKMMWRHRNTLCTGRSEIRWYDLLMLGVLWLWFWLRVAAMVHYRHVARTPHVPRMEWPSQHLFMWAECCYSVGVILAVVRLNGLALVSSHLGPMQISLQRMVSDILRFVLFFFVILSAFAISITKIYGSYQGARRYDPDTGAIIEQPNHFVNFHHTYKNLFWALFGYPEVMENSIIVVNEANTSHLDNLTRGDGNHNVLEVWGFILVGAFHCVAVIVLLNMLIAMMANSYNSIEANADTEWKFARTRLRLTFHNEVGSLPPPFNIMLIGLLIKKVSGAACCGACTYCSEAQCDVRLQAHTCNNQKLMAKLSKRYWSKHPAACSRSPERPVQSQGTPADVGATDCHTAFEHLMDGENGASHA